MAGMAIAKLSLGPISYISISMPISLMVYEVRYRWLSVFELGIVVCGALWINVGYWRISSKDNRGLWMQGY